MDLALALGTTVADLQARLTVREWNLWRLYSSRRGLPYRRLEMGLAQVTRFIAITMGGVKDSTLADFMFDPIEDTAGDESDMEDDDDDDPFGSFPVDGIRYVDPNED